MDTLAASFASLTAAVAADSRIAYPLAEFNDLLTAALADEIESLPWPAIVPISVELRHSDGGTGGQSSRRRATAVDE